MQINYDPNGKPSLPAHMVDAAREHGLHPLHVICDEHGGQECERAPVSFWALTAFQPQAGDRILLEKGEACQVIRTTFKVVTHRDENGAAQVVLLVPTVYATRMSAS